MKKSKTPKISVIIPAYNAEKTLRKCLLSVLKQDYKDYEIIVCNNNSTDKTGQIIKESQKNNKKIKPVFEKKKGRGPARNACIRKASGKIILMIDSDCIAPENWIKKMTQLIINGKESVTMSGEEDLIGNYWTKRIQKANSDFVRIGLKNGYAHNIDTKNFAIRSDIMKELMFDSQLKALEDFEFYLRLKKIAKIRFIEDARVGHCHPSSFKKLARTNFDRAYAAKIIFDKHKGSSDLKNEPMTQSLSLINFLMFPPWILFQFFKKPFKDAYFTLVADASWRLGIIWSGLNKLFRR